MCVYFTNMFHTLSLFESALLLAKIEKYTATPQKTKMQIVNAPGCTLVTFIDLVSLKYPRIK